MDTQVSHGPHFCKRDLGLGARMKVDLAVWVRSGRVVATNFLLLFIDDLFFFSIFIGSADEWSSASLKLLDRKSVV